MVVYLLFIQTQCLQPAAQAQHRRQAEKHPETDQAVIPQQYDFIEVLYNYFIKKLKGLYLKETLCLH